MPKPQIIMVSEGSAATWSTSTDILEQDTFGQTLKDKPYPRILSRIAIVGDSALGEGMILSVGSETVAKVLSTNATAFDANDKHDIDCEVLAGELVVANPTGASTTNKFVVYFEFDEHPAMKLARLRALTNKVYYANKRSSY
jgi:hypothetical protein